MRLRTLCILLLGSQVAWSQHKLGDAYVSKEDLPDAVRFIAAPPDTTDALFFADYIRYTWGKQQRQTERGEQARRDADYRTPYVASYFSGALGTEISPIHTPATYRLLSNVCQTASDATRKPKKHYMRRRPYVQFNEPTLVPEEEEVLRPTGSFPSGHTSIGWAVALVLTEVCPQAADTLLAAGFQYGQSRVIAGFHYQSDVDQARSVAAAAVARMHSEEAFLTDIAAARKELQEILQKTTTRENRSNARPEKRKSHSKGRTREKREK